MNVIYDFYLQLEGAKRYVQDVDKYVDCHCHCYFPRLLKASENVEAFSPLSLREYK